MSEESVILVDIPGGEEADTAFLKSLGHTVVVCHGPEPRELCPILSGLGCPKAQSAHGIVFMLDLDRPQHRAILKRYQEVLKDDVPIGVRVTTDQATRYSALLSGLDVWTREPGTAEFDALAAEVETAEQFW